MGALINFDEYIEKLRLNIGADFQASSTGRALRANAAYRVFVPTPSTPTASVTLNNTSDVAIGPLPTTSTGKLTLLGGRINPGGISGIGLILVDLLVQQGGLSGTITTGQTTNLPTSVLPRYTGGTGVMIGLVIYSLVGTTLTTITVSYTNELGTSGRTSTATSFGSTSFREVGALIQIPLQVGDLGVRSVQSVTLAGTTGIAGDFGVVLYKPLAMMPLNDFQGAHIVDAISTGGFTGALAQAEANACISILTIGNVIQAITGTILVAEV
jgi:hypothetical protein